MNSLLASGVFLLFQAQNSLKQVERLRWSVNSVPVQALCTSVIIEKYREYFCPDGEHIYEVSYLLEDYRIEHCEQTWTLKTSHKRILKDGNPFSVSALFKCVGGTGQQNSPVSIFHNKSECRSPCTWSTSGKIQLNQCVDLTLTVVCSEETNTWKEVRVHFSGKKVKGLGQNKRIGLCLSVCLFAVLLFILVCSARIRDP